MTGHVAWGLGVATFLATFVELVEALTIVLAMGITRGWRSALAGAAAAVVCLVAFTAAAGYALATWLPEAVLQLVVGVLLLVFGLQWLRKAVRRSAGLETMHDEEEAFRRQTAAGRAAGRGGSPRLDWFGFVVSFKGVFLEGVEVVFIVITFGLNAGDIRLAALAAAAATVVVVVLGLVASKPLAAVPENTVKYVVGLLLTTFGTYWAVEGLGVVGTGRSLSWPGGSAVLPLVLLGWLALSWMLVITLRRRGPRAGGRLSPAAAPKGES